jgi:hypothetical protein
MAKRKEQSPCPYQYSYSRADYLEGDEPYKELWAIQSPFLQDREATKMGEHARSVGVNNFKSLWASYKRSMKGAAAGDDTFINVTEFSGQPVELISGQWIANDTGVYWINRMSGEKERICPHAIMPVERLVNIDTGEERLKLAYNKGFGWRTLVADKAVTSSAQKIISLASHGIAVNSETARPMVRYLADLENENMMSIPERHSVGRLGYIRGHGFSPYVAGLEFDGDANFRHMFRAVQSRGLVSSWLSAAQYMRRHSDAAKILLAASFASALVEPMGALPFFCHVWGIDSGTGKTVGLMLAASVWGNPAIGEYIQTFNGTVVGHEKTAAFLNNLPLILDELQLSRDGRGNLNFDVYKLAQGVGRTRGNRNGGVDMTPRWANCIITSGESPIVDQHAGAGAVNRVISVEVEAVNPVVTADSGNSLATTMRENYGFAGYTFVQELYGDPDTVEDVKARVGALIRALSRGNTTEKQAASAALVVAADELACRWIFDGEEQPITVEEIGKYLATKESVSAGKRGYEWLCDWVSQNANRFDGTFTQGEIYGDIDGNTAYIIRKVFDDAVKAAGFSPKSLLSYLRSAGLIFVREKGFTKPKRLGKTVTECIWLKLPQMWYDDTGEDVEPLQENI